MTRTPIAVAALALALGGCGKKQDEGQAAQPPTAESPPTTPAQPTPEAPPPEAEPPQPPPRTPVEQGPVTLLSANAPDTAVATWKRGEVEVELFAVRTAEDQAKGTVSARVSSRVNGKEAELHVCDELYAAAGGRAFVQLDASGAIYVVCNTRKTAQEPDWFKGIRLVWNDDEGALEQAGEFESEAVFDPDTMDFGE